jgi:hypothetical protein
MARRDRPVFGWRDTTPCPRVAAGWIEDGLFTAEADVPSRLGKDLAQFSFAAGAVSNSAGVRLLFGPGASGS